MIKETSSFARKALRPLLIAAGAILITGCQINGQAAPVKGIAPNANLAFVQTQCGDCHGVQAFDLSPNPLAPTFAAIINRDDVSAGSLTDWLIDAHNYPEVMDFDITEEQAEMVADHMLTLRKPGYTPDS